MSHSSRLVSQKYHRPLHLIGSSVSESQPSVKQQETRDSSVFHKLHHEDYWEEEREGREEVKVFVGWKWDEETKKEERKSEETSGRKRQDTPVQREKHSDTSHTWLSTVAQRQTFSDLWRNGTEANHDAADDDEEGW